MSRIGKRPIALPSGTTVSVNGQTIEAKGAKGTLSMTFSDLVQPSMQDGELVIEPRPELRAAAEKKMADNDARGRKKMTFALSLIHI